MLATEGSVEKLKATQWAFEGKWDGYRLLVEADHGRHRNCVHAVAVTSRGVPAIAGGGRRSRRPSRGAGR